jgi:hypothetical protein
MACDTFSLSEHHAYEVRHENAKKAKFKRRIGKMKARPQPARQ